MYGRPVSVGTLRHHSVHTSDRAGDCTSPIYRLCALYVVVNAATTLVLEGIPQWKRVDQRPERVA